MNKLKGYTVMEMMVVMLISSVVITMSYAVFTRVVVLNKKVGEIYHKNYNLILFNRLVSADFLNSEKVVQNPYGFSCLYKDRKVTYELSDFLFRIQNTVSDTLYTVLNTEVEYEYIDKEKQIIRSVKIKGQYNEEPLELIFEKEYGADLLMKLDEQGN